MIFYVFLTLAVIVLYQFEGIRRYLRLPETIDVWQGVASWADRTINSMIGESRTEVVVVGAFWAIVGLVVYALLHGLARYIAELDDDFAVRRFVWPKGADRSRPLKLLVERTAIRIVALVGLGVVVFGPLAAVVKGPVFAGQLGDYTILLYPVWFIASMLMWHAVVVLVRLFVLRVRILPEA